MMTATRRGSRAARAATIAAALSVLHSPQHVRAQTARPHALFPRVEQVLGTREAAFIELRRDLHRHPELSGREERTAAIVAQRLRELGLTVRTGVGGHGVVAVLRGGKPGPVIAYRADMDAATSNDVDPVDFRSTVPGVRHICGHDIHTTIGIALAEGLAAVRADLPGTVLFVFQPAEEAATGARAMLADGVFGTLHPQAIFGLHTSPAPVGWLGSAPGVLMAGRDRLTITIAGTGNLQSAADTVRRLIQSVGTIRRDQEAQPAPEGFVLAQVGPVERGSHGTWTVHGTLTIASADARRRARDVLTRQLDALSLPDVQVRVAYDAKAIAGVTNDSLLVAKADASIRRVLGQDAVSTVTGIYPAFSEDFGSFQERIPGAFYFLGVSNREKGWLGLPHSPAYVADEASILVGARAMSAVILDRLAETPRR